MRDLELPKIQKLLALGLNQAAAVGEVENSAIMLFRHLRAAGVEVSEVADVIRESLGELPAEPAFANPYANVICNFGKYRGEMLDDIFAHNPSYLVWVVRESNVSVSKKAPFLGYLRAINYPL